MLGVILVALVGVPTVLFGLFMAGYVLARGFSHWERRYTPRFPLSLFPTLDEARRRIGQNGLHEDFQKVGGDLRAAMQRESETKAAR
jgi:hypothetical protein